MTALLIALVSVACTEQPQTARGAAAGLDPAAQALWKEYAARDADPVAALRAEAHRLGERLRTGLEAEEWEQERARLPAIGQAPAFAPQAASLPWAAWIAEDRLLHAELAAATLRGAYAALGAEVLPLARACDDRTTPDALRLEAHRLFWAVDPGEALPRGRALLFREGMRVRDTIRPGYLESVLALAPPAEALDLLLQSAAYDGMESRARLLAIRLLGERREAQAVPVMEQIFLAERANFLVRREAMLTLLVLHPQRGRALLARRLPEEQADPALADFLRALRDEHGVHTG